MCLKMLDDRTLTLRNAETASKLQNCKLHSPDAANSSSMSYSLTRVVLVLVLLMLLLVITVVSVAVCIMKGTSSTASSLGPGSVPLEASSLIASALYFVGSGPGCHACIRTAQESLTFMLTVGYDHTSYCHRYVRGWIREIVQTLVLVQPQMLHVCAMNMESAGRYLEKGK